MNRISPILTMIALTFPLSLQALELELETGYTDNPFSEKNANSGSTYVGLSAQYKGRTEGKSHLRYSVDVDLRQFERSDADTEQVRARVRWVQQARLFDRSASFLYTADAGMKRKDYVDQLTGDPALSRDGSKIRERYNYDFGKIGIEGILRFDKSKSIAIYTYYEKRNYINDYQDLELEPLDYTEIGFQSSFRLKTKRGTYFRAMIFDRSRSYLGLLNDDKAGRNVEGSTVDYRLKGGSLLLKCPVTERLTAGLYVVGYQARDSYVGTRDLDVWKADGSIKLAFNNDALLTITAGVANRDYINDKIGRRNPEQAIPGKQQRILVFSVQYQAPLGRRIRDLTWSLSYNNKTVSNSDDRRSFKRNDFTLGLTYRW